MDGMGGHHRYRGRSDEWLTPPYVLAALGPFDLDPCSPADRPWPTAKVHYTAADDGLSKPWEGRVFLNPPYGPDTGKWLKRLAGHGRGTALVFARTETRAFFEWVWPCASALLFFRGRLWFYRVDGTRAENCGGAPSALVAYGADDAKVLKTCGLAGAYVPLRPRKPKTAEDNACR